MLISLIHLENISFIKYWYIKFNTFLNDRSFATFQEVILSMTVFDTCHWKLALVAQIILHYIWWKMIGSRAAKLQCVVHERTKIKKYQQQYQLSWCFENVSVPITACHRLRGSASPVLTATGFVNGKGQFSTPTESNPLNRSPKALSQVITSATPTAMPN